MITLKGCNFNFMELTLPIQFNRPVKVIGTHEIINWYKAKIFTVMDIKNSPFRAAMVESFE